MRSRKEQLGLLEKELAAARKRISELEREVESASLRDDVTGLPSLQVLWRQLDAEVDRSRRHGRALSVAMFDVDGFGAINAAHGRELGDAVLKSVARVLSGHTRGSDLASRSGADEFVLLLPEVGAADASQAAQRLLLELEAVRVGPLESLSASVGIADWQRGMSSDELLTAASARVREARDAGGGQTQAGGDAGTYDGAVSGLAEALTERDNYTGEHSEEVLDLVLQVARGLALDDAEIERIRRAALLHDIGKVAIPDDVLHKARPLDEAEWEVMRQHPVIGERILRAIPGLGSVARIVRHEHESFDGSGYPDGLVGNDIPIGARIILACDAYHAMTSDRPYRKAMSHSDAIRELGRCAGTQFDPRVTEVLIGCLYGRRQMSGSGA